jgi:hypothetical protein
MSPGPLPYADKGGGGALPPHGEDYFNRIVGVHWREPAFAVAEQGLLAITSGGVSSSAIALDTGESFGGMSSGASGLLRSSKPWTVLSSGIVVYGQPKEKASKPCFMACTDGKTIQRGTEDVGGDMEGIVWEAVYSLDNVWALSFAGGGFFVMSGDLYHGSSDRISCAVSFDGENFSNIGNIYSGVPTSGAHFTQTPGSVASNGQGIYASAGVFFQDDNYPRIQTSDNNMMWASSNDGQSWNSGYSYPEAADPGIRPVAIFVGAGSGAYTTIAGGNGRFVAAATAHSLFQSTVAVPGTGGTEFIKYVRPTAAAAISSDGSSWTTKKLPSATEASYVELGGGNYNIAESNSISVAFVRTSGVAGYFLITANGYMQEGASQSSQSWCWKGDGSSWSIIRQVDDPSYGTVSAIAKNLSATKIVFV